MLNLSSPLRTAASHQATAYLLVRAGLAPDKEAGEGAGKVHGQVSAFSDAISYYFSGYLCYLLIFNIICSTNAIKLSLSL